MVRPKDHRVWQHYRQAENKTVFCNYCDKIYKLPHVSRMKTHLVKCHKCPDRFKEDLSKSQDLNAGNTLQDNNNENLSSNSDACNSSNSTSSQGITKDQKEDLDNSLAMAIYVSGAPLSVVENSLWEQFFNKLQPIYKLPSRKAISTTHLDKAFKKMSHDLDNEIRTQDFLHLQLDGWSNVNNSGIINFLISKPEPVFVKSIDTAQNRHTGEYLEDELLKVMRHYDESKFVVLIGDNARNIQRAFSLIRETHRHITPLNCIAHTLNLLSYNVLQPEGLKAFIDLAVDTVKVIKKSQLLTATLKNLVTNRNAGETLKLPCKTRWGSYRICLMSLQNTKAALQSLAIYEAVSSILPMETKATLLDDSFWDYTAQGLKILNPISDVITKLESNECNIVNVLLTLKDMKSKIDFVLPDISILGVEDKEFILRLIDHKINNCIKPIHLAAHLLDPRLLGNELTEVQEMEAFEYINNMAQYLGYSNIMTILANYRAKQGTMFGKSVIWNNICNIDPIAWWKGLCGSSNLSKIACRILTAPCTSAAVERSFSKHGFIHSKLRNRLTNERAAKITYLSYNWNLINNKNNQRDNEDSDFEMSFSPVQWSNDEAIETQSSTSSSIILNNAEPEASTSRNDFEFMDCSAMPDSDSD